jgi:hypothetical protein
MQERHRNSQDMQVRLFFGLWRVCRVFRAGRVVELRGSNINGQEFKKRSSTDRYKIDRASRTAVGLKDQHLTHASKIHSASPASHPISKTRIHRHIQSQHVRSSCSLLVPLGTIGHGSFRY